MSTDHQLLEEEQCETDVLSTCSSAIYSDNSETIRQALPQLGLEDVMYLADLAAKQPAAATCFTVLIDVLAQSSRKLAFVTPLLCECAIHDSVEHLRQHINKIDSSSPSYIKVFLSALRNNSEQVVQYLSGSSPAHVLSTVCTAALQDQNDAMVQALYPLVPVGDIPSILSLAIKEASRKYDSQDLLQYLDEFVSDLPTPTFLAVYRFNHSDIKAHSMTSILARYQKEQLLKTIAGQPQAPESARVRRM